MSNKPEILVERAHQIYEDAYSELRGYLGEKVMSFMEATDKEDFSIKPDYITIFEEDDDTRAQLNGGAAQMGREFYRKRGPMYEIPLLELPTTIVRIVEPDPDPEVAQSDGVDFAFGFESFSKAKELIIAKAPKYEIRSNVARNQEEGSESIGYTYVKTLNPDSPVTVTCLSTSFVDIVRQHN